MRYLTNINLLQNQLQNAVVHHVSATSDITNPVEGQICYVTGAVKKLYYYDGTKWVDSGLSGADIVTLINNSDSKIDNDNLGLMTTSQTANKVLASPDGASGNPTFRSLAVGDLPSITSAQLAGKVSDETGTGLVVFNNTPTLTTPKINTILDTNGNEVVILSPIASAVNELTIKNAATDGSPTISATGTDTNINLVLEAKGTGTVQAPTVANGNNSTAIATTAFVNAEIASDAAPKSHVGATGSAHGVATTSVNGFMSSTDKTKLDGIASGAEVNQNAFTTIAVYGQTDVVADQESDTLTLVAGTNVSITTNATNDSITIKASQSTDIKTLTVTDTDNGYTWASTGSATANAVGDTVTIVDGAGVDIDADATNKAIRISHTDTSSVTDLSSATNTFIAAQTYDTYGHVQTRTTGTVDFTVTANHAFQKADIATDTGYTWGAANTNTTQTADSNTDTIAFVAGGGINLYTSTVAATDAIKIENSDKGSSQNIFKNMTDGTNTAVADSNNDTFTFAQNGGLTVLVDATNDKVTYSHADTSSVSNLNSDNSGNTVIQDIKFDFDTYGHVTSASVATVTLHSQNTDTGTTSTTFALDSDATNGVLLKNSDGELQLRSLTDASYANLRVKDLTVEGTQTIIKSTEVDIGDNTILLNANITASAQNTDGGFAVKRLATDNTTRKDASVIYNETSDRWETTFGDIAGTIVTATVANKLVYQIGNGALTSFVLTHNLNTRDLSVTVRQTAEDYELVMTDVKFTSLNTITLNFALAPSNNQYTVTIIG